MPICSGYIKYVDGVCLWQTSTRTDIIYYWKGCLFLTDKYQARWNISHNRMFVCDGQGQKTRASGSRGIAFVLIGNNIKGRGIDPVAVYIEQFSFLSFSTSPSPPPPCSVLKWKKANEPNRGSLWDEDFFRNSSNGWWLDSCFLKKHCQRHNGPEGWVLLTKVTSWGHIKNWHTNLDQISSSESRTKHQLQNFKQTSASRLNLKFKILSRISTKIQLHNLYKTSATKYRPNSSFKFCLNFNFKILTKPCAQSLNKSLALWTILSYQICNKLLPIQSSFLIINISNSNNINKFWVGIFTRQGHINQVYLTGVSERVSQWVSDKHSKYDRTRVR